MKFGVCLPQYGREVSLDDLRAVASDAEELGFDSVWVSDHVVTPEHLRKSIGPVFLDAFVVLSHVSALTERVRLGTTVMVTPYRNPLVAAKMIATLDALSGGRVTLGVGAGGAPDEFAALGVLESRRGALTDEYLSAMIELWSNDPSSFHGRHVSFDGVRFAPKPTQKPHPPIWVGGGQRRRTSPRRAIRPGMAPDANAPRRAEGENGAAGPILCGSRPRHAAGNDDSPIRRLFSRRDEISGAPFWAWHPGAGGR
jgi:probable F420-dependent oxidoreductase